jgi:hypothetical protein
LNSTWRQARAMDEHGDRRAWVIDENGDRRARESMSPAATRSRSIGIAIAELTTACPTCARNATPTLCRQCAADVSSELIVSASPVHRQCVVSVSSVQCVVSVSKPCQQQAAQDNNAYKRTPQQGIQTDTIATHTNGHHSNAYKRTP